MTMTDPIADMLTRIRNANSAMFDTVKMPGSKLKESLAGILEREGKPGLRIYARADGIPRVLGGMGVAVLSTSQGLVTDREARKKHLGGEVLCHVW